MRAQRGARATLDPPIVRAVLIALVLVFLSAFLFLPLVAVVIEAMGDGLGGFARAVSHPDTLAAIRLTLFATLIAMPLNVVFGLAASWAIARFDFRGKSLLITLIDLPFAVSPVIAGMLFVLLFGARGIFGPFLYEHGIRILFATPGIVLATIFVTFPYVARELIPFMQSQGAEEEEAALVLGASGFQTFFRVTLPNVKWSLLYGVVLGSARAMGEFGAVSVVSGHIRGSTNTVPLHVEVLYNEYRFSAAFAVATILVVISLVSLAAKRIVASLAKGGASRREGTAEASSDAGRHAPLDLAVTGE